MSAEVDRVAGAPDQPPAAIGWVAAGAVVGPGGLGPISESRRNGPSVDRSFVRSWNWWQSVQFADAPPLAPVCGAWHVVHDSIVGISTSLVSELALAGA